MTAAYYKSANDKSNNNEDVVLLLLKDDVGKSRVGSRARSHDPRSYYYGVTIAFLFGMSSDKQIIVKSYLQLGKKLSNPTGEKGGKPVLF